MVVTICTSNADKAQLLAACVAEAGFDARHVALELAEPQADTSAAVVRAKAASARARIGGDAGGGGPILVEDSGLVIPALGGFPGPYTKYALATIGARGLVTLAAGAPCRFASALGLARGDEVAIGEHGLAGTIAADVAGACDGSWSDLWRIVIPSGEAQPLSALAPAARAAHLTAWRAQLVAWLAAALR